MYTVTTTKLTIKQQRFLEFYLGADPELAGNATQSYKAAYGCSVKVADKAGPRLLGNVGIKAEIERVREKVAEKIEITAQTVLKQSLELLEQATGKMPMIHESVRPVKSKDGDITYDTVRTMLCNTNLAMANQLLNTIGRNTLVQAFQDNVEVSHVHHLEEVLNRRSKEVEERAALRLVKDSAEIISP